MTLRKARQIVRTHLPANAGGWVCADGQVFAEARKAQAFAYCAEASLPDPLFVAPSKLK